jgi:hypothetical protein
MSLTNFVGNIPIWGLQQKNFKLTLQLKIGLAFCQVEV